MDIYNWSKIYKLAWIKWGWMIEKWVWDETTKLYGQYWPGDISPARDSLGEYRLRRNRTVREMHMGFQIFWEKEVARLETDEFSVGEEVT